MQQRSTIPNSAGTKELKAMNMLKQRRDSFQFGGKYELNLKLTVFFTAGFLEIWKYKSRDLICQKYLEFETGLEHTQEFD